MAIIWKGDTLSNWDGSELVNKTRVAVVASKRENQEILPLRFVLGKNDYPPNVGTSGPRAELLRKDGRKEGEERFTAFSVYFPKDFATKDGSWQVFHQYHQTYKRDDAGGWTTIGRSPPVEFAVNGRTLSLKTNDYKAPDYAVTTHWSQPLETEHWYDFILHARWSSDPKVGFVRLFLDGLEVLKRTPCATMFPGYGVYLKAGLYRKKDIEGDSIIYQSGYTETTTLEEALAAQPFTPTKPDVPDIVPPTPPQVADTGWRTGHKLGTTIYRDGVIVATMVMGQTDEAKKLAQDICDAMNAKGAA